MPIRDKIALYYGYSHALINNGIGAYLPYLTSNQVKILQTALNKSLRFALNIAGRTGISMTKMRAIYNILGVDILKHETLERLSCELKDEVIEKYDEVQNYTGRNLRSRRVSNWFVKSDLPSEMLKKVKRKTFLLEITYKKTLKTVQKLFRKLTFYKILGFHTPEFENSIISRVELFVNNEPSLNSARALKKFPSLSQSRLPAYEKLCSAQADIALEANRLGCSFFEAENSLSFENTSLQNVGLS